MTVAARKAGSARRDRRDEAAARKAARVHLTVAPDPAPEAVLPAEAGQRVPLHARDLPAPEPLPSWNQIRGAARYRAAMARVHARRSHRYAGHVARWSAAGAGKACRWWWELATAPDHRALYKLASKAGDRKGRDGHLSAARYSAVWAGVAAVGAGLPLLAVIGVAGRLGLLVYGAATVAALAALGRRPDEHLPSVPAAAAPVLSPDTILKAFDDSGFGGAKTFGAPAREGKGINKRTKVLVDLGPGKDQTGSTAIKKREVIAANLQRDLRCVHLARGGHAGQVILTILDTDPMAGPPVPSPLLTLAEFSLWDPVPWGFDIRGNTVFLPLLWTSLLVGAKPRMGKTFAIRTLVLAGILDPHALVYLWDGKGAGDYRAFRPMCARWGQGFSALKEHPKQCLEMLWDVSRLVEERSAKIDQLPTHLRPEGKLTREVATNPAYGLPVILVVIDEVQRLIADPLYGDKIRDELIALAQNAPSCGVILIIGTQRPTQQTGKGSLGDLPPAMGTRAAFKTMDAGESNVILGDGHAGKGWDSSIFDDDYEGVCLLRSGAEVDEGPKGVQQVKTFYANDMMLEAKVAEVAAARRPTSSGPTVVLEKPVLDDHRGRLAALFEDGEDRLSIPEAADRAGEDGPEIRAWCRKAGVEVKKIRLGNRTDWGIKRADLD